LTRSPSKTVGFPEKQQRKRNVVGIGFRSIKKTFAWFAPLREIDELSLLNLRKSLTQSRKAREGRSGLED
jgi:hypothetical protein